MALILKYITIQLILDNLLDNPLLSDLTLERVVNYTVRLMRKVGCPLLFYEKTLWITIKDYRGILPCDFLNIILVRSDNGKCFRYSTDSFHLSLNKDKIKKDIYNKDNPDLTYKIQGNCIFTSIEDGDVEISYNSILVDKDGYPMIPDDESFIDAIEKFVKKEKYNILFDEGKISQQSLLIALLEYAFAIGLASNSLTMPTIDLMEAIKNMWTSLIQRTTHHKDSFSQLGNQEYIRLH